MRNIRRFVLKHRRYFIWLAAAMTILILVYTTWLDHEGVADYGSLVLNVVLLAITATTLRLTIPDRARIWLDRQGELGIDDLLFFVVGDSPEGRPRDILLQLHVAVSNIGGRKAVLSRVELISLLDHHGRSVRLRFGPVRAVEYSTRNRWLDTFAVLQGQQNNLQHFSIRDELPGPYSLAPDDVITLRLRARVGIDWSARWSLEALQSYANELERPIERARLAAVYRRGDEVVTDHFEVPVVEKQQAMYLEALRFTSQNLTVRPEMEPLYFHDS